MGIELNNFNTYLDNFSNANETENIKSRVEPSSEGNIKTCLKSKILEKRKKLGLGKVEVDFTPKENYPMTKEEIEKDRRRRQINRRSANKSRQKQKDEMEKNELLLQQLKEQQKQLILQCNETESEKTKYVEALKQYIPESKIHEAVMKTNQDPAESCTHVDMLIEAEHAQQVQDPESIQEEATILTIPSEFGEIHDAVQNIHYIIDSSDDNMANNIYTGGHGEVLVLENIVDGGSSVVQLDESMPGTYYIINDSGNLDLQTVDGSILYTTDSAETLI